MLSLILPAFLMGAGSVGGQLAATAIWDRFFKAHPEAREMTEAMYEAIVRAAQAMIVVLGEADIDVDGKLGKQTADAIKDYQAKKGLEEIDGLPGRDTMRALTGDLLTKLDQK